jgi:glycerophosphoryl diester phosphodiesterase
MASLLAPEFVERLQAIARELGLTLAPPGVPAAPTQPYVIAHRGASGYLPEHTLEAYGLAILLGADFIEPDLVATRDGVLVARHDNQLDLTTDVAQHAQFAARRRRNVVDGTAVEGWFSEDFTAAELRTLRARERIPQLRPGNCRHDGAFAVPTLAEILELVHFMEPLVGRRIGLYPETKHPSHFQALGLALEPPLVAQLHAAGYRRRGDPVFLQSFEIANLQTLRTLTDLPLVQLLGEPHEQPYDALLRGESLGYGEMMTPAGMTTITRYANAIGPDKTLLLAADGSVDQLRIAAAHARGLQVHPYTFRNENHFLPATYRRQGGPGDHGDGVAEIADYLAAGIDGFFTDFTDAGVAAKCAVIAPQS